ncbi:hypothetical protein [Streptomyces sp. NPDC047097]|uniref:hypothetical protein n=1 Tax=Streptomyces sp. NPDC047097 TaxID=3155260 RepID=UPI00341178D9
MPARTRTIAILTGLAIATTLTACGSIDQADPKPEITPSAQAVESEAPGTGGDGRDTDALSKPLKLGQPAETIGDGGEGALELTPSSIVYTSGTEYNEPENDLFAFITVKARATNAAAASMLPPISGGGWSWVAPDGQAIDVSNGASYNLVANSFNSGGKVQPGTFQWDGVAFDLTTAQKGGTLMYEDGAGQTYSWTIPGADAGPDVAKVKRELS